SRAAFSDLFETSYAATFGRTIPGLGVEIMTWTLRLAAGQPAAPAVGATRADVAGKANGSRTAHDQDDQGMRAGSMQHRRDLLPGSFMPGPAIIAEDETTTVVPKGFVARLNAIGAILLEKVDL